MNKIQDSTAPIPTAAFHPTPEDQRINSVDVIRGVALFGILLMNITGMGLPEQAYSDPSVAGGATGWDLKAWITTNMLFEGTMRGMFSMLFGAGVILFTSKKEAMGIGLPVADSWYRRTIWLFVFGLIHAYILLWPGEILYAYGLIGMFLFPFRHMAPKNLFAIGIGLLLAGAVWGFFEIRGSEETYAEAQTAQALIDRGEKPSKALQTSLDDWNEKIKHAKPTAEDLAEVTTKQQGGYFEAMKLRAAETFHWQSEGHYRYNYFDVLGMMLLGMALLGWRIFQAERSFRFYGMMVLVGYSIGLTVNWYETSTILNSNFDLIATQKTYLTYDLGRLFTTAGHIGLIMLFCKSGALFFLQRALAAVGRMALTNYIMHTVITTTVFVLFAQFGKWQRHELYYLVFGIWAFQLVLSPLWLRYFYFGPVEWGWRALTYLKKPPFLKTQ